MGNQNPSVSNKRIAINTIMLYMRSLIIMLVSLYTSRLVLKYLGVQDYGIYNVVGGTVTMFSMLSGSMASATQRYITFTLGENDFAKLKSVFSTSITLHLCLGLLMILLMEVVGIWFLYNKMNIPADRVSTAFWVLQFSIATLFVNILSVPFNAAIIAHERMKAFAYIGILDGLLQLGAACLLMFSFGDKLILYSVLMFGISVLLRLIYSVYSHRHFDETRHIKIHIEHGLFKEMSSFAGWNLFGNGSLLLRNQGIDILLNLFFGVTVNAAKGISNIVNKGVHQLITNFNTAVNPQLTKAIAQRDKERTNSLIFQASRFSFYLMMLFSIPIVMTTSQILNIWLEEVPNYTVEFIRWTFVYMLLDTLSRFLIMSVLAFGDIKVYQISVGSVKLLAIPMAYIWLRLGGSPLVGIWVNIILEVASLLLRLYFNKKIIKLSIRQYCYKVIGRCALVIFIAFTACMAIKLFLPMNFIILIVLTFSISLLTIAFVGISNSERILAVNMVKNIANRIKRKTV